MNVGHQPSRRVLDRFPYASKRLQLEAFVHDCQRGEGLKLGVFDEGGGDEYSMDPDHGCATDEKDEWHTSAESSFSRPMLLIRGL